MDDYETRGDPDGPFAPTRRDERAQAQAVATREAVQRSHFHQITSGESTGSYLSHTHENDADGHVHPGRQVFPLRADGGYFEESGPSLGRALPPGVAANAARALEMIRRWPATPPCELMRWRLQLYCGHLIERTAHAEHRTLHGAFTGSVRCSECGLDPATIVAARPLGRVAERPDPPVASKPRVNRTTLERRLTKAKAEVERLQAEIDALVD